MFNKMFNQMFNQLIQRSPQSIKVFVWFIFAFVLFQTNVVRTAQAVQIDWNGQFWAENNWLNNYQLSRGRLGSENDQSLVSNGSTYVPGTGEKNIVWYAAFLKLKPKLVVNDSINIKGEFHVGSPIYGFFGRSFPTSGDERFNFTGAQKDNLLISAQRFWANLVTDFGTIELGRAPLHWGLGAIWNAGDNLFERYQSTGDMVRLTSKFGNFSVQPAIVKVAMGNNAAGANVGATSIQGNDDITDYDLAVKYDNSEEELQFGVMWTKRIGNTSQKSLYLNSDRLGSTRLNFNLFDFYAQKKWGHFSFGSELPLFNGSLGAMDGQTEYDYKTLAFLFEGAYSSDLWDVGLKLGHVPGQPRNSSGDNKFRAVYLNKDYKLGLIMFNYNIYGLTSNNPDTTASSSLNSPYDNQIVNANYLSLVPEFKLDKWTFKGGVILAFAEQTAQAGKRFYNYQQRRFKDALANQSSFLGKEFDLGASFRWDENFIVSWDLGFWFPGGYYEFNNTPGMKAFDTDMMFASQVRVGVSF